MKGEKSKVGAKKAKRQQKQKLARLRELLQRPFWSATDASLALIGIDPDTITPPGDSQGYCFECLPGRRFSDFVDPDDQVGLMVGSTFDFYVETSRKLVRSKGQHAIDTPAKWVEFFLSFNQQVPWIEIARKDQQCLILLNPQIVNEDNSVQETPQRRGGLERAKNTSGRFLRDALNDWFKRWHAEPSLYEHLTHFKKDMRRKFVSIEADSNYKEINKDNVFVRTDKTFYKHFNLSLKERGVPK